ncbi:hypothetical protein TSAR_016968 [Trichomalopsis sarcophagae]|uniref:Uncharacterized protein n=1 Tax=Trichomalopsis sarcophagae TaxID=543379 RepID=A0A232EXX1_9HYME|nr:hypothetical protein TSAR_016968 [Trichomalopsis sarcophagae]
MEKQGIATFFNRTMEDTVFEDTEILFVEDSPFGFVEESKVSPSNKPVSGVAVAATSGFQQDSANQPIIAVDEIPFDFVEENIIGQSIEPVSDIAVTATSVFQQDSVNQQIIEVEVHSENNNNDAATNQSLLQPSPSFEMPSQQLQSIDSIFSLGGKEFFLNNCGSKRLVIGITIPSIPEIKITFKIHDLKNGRQISFGKKTWDRIVACEEEIRLCMDNNIMIEIFNSNRIHVETQMMYRQCCVQFYDYTETSITMMKPTFMKMMSFKEEVENVYIELFRKKNDVAKRIKMFVDISFFHLLKSNNPDNRHNYNWVTLFMNQSSNFLELSNSVAATWAQLGNWIAEEQAQDLTNEP